MALVSSSLRDHDLSFLVNLLEWPDLRPEMKIIHRPGSGQGRKTSCTFKDDSILANVSKLTISQSDSYHPDTFVRVPAISNEVIYYSDEIALMPLENDERNMASLSENPPESSGFESTAHDKDAKYIPNEDSLTKHPQRNKKKSKRKKPIKKLRIKSEKKWKTLPIEEFGMNISLLPKLPSADISYYDSESSVDEHYYADSECHFQDLKVSMPNCRLVEFANAKSNCNFDTKKCVQQVLPSEENTETNNFEDDVVFFGKLGIDILNDDYESDPIMDWDCLIFPRPRSAKCDIIDRPSDMTGLSNKLKHENIRSTRNSRGEDLFYHPSGASFSIMKKCESYKLYELECSSSSSKVYVRPDRNRRVEKAHKAIKSKNCSAVFNNKGHKPLYMHHRLIKINNITLDFRQNARHPPIPAMTKLTLDLSVAKGVIKANKNIRDKQPAPVENVKHALRETNAPHHLERDFASFLISLQLRELTPEDYEMLLRLDESVKPKTVPKNILDSMRTETVGPNGIDANSDDMPPVCTICMEPYVAGQERKFLPCNHNFHTKCIDVWLKSSSMNCPLDGLAVDAT